MITSRRSAAFSAPSRLFDLNGETNRVRKKQSSAIIAADVRRFSYLINTDEVFGTDTGIAREKRVDQRRPLQAIRYHRAGGHEHRTGQLFVGRERLPLERRHRFFGPLSVGKE